MELISFNHSATPSQLYTLLSIKISLPVEIELSMSLLLQKRLEFSSVKGPSAGESKKFEKNIKPLLLVTESVSQKPRFNELNSLNRNIYRISVTLDVSK